MLDRMTPPKIVPRVFVSLGSSSTLMAGLRAGLGDGAPGALGAVGREEGRAGDVVAGGGVGSSGARGSLLSRGVGVTFAPGVVFRLFFHKDIFSKARAAAGVAVPKP